MKKNNKRHMIKILIGILSALFTQISFANSYDIKTSTDKNGNTLFYLQAGAFSKKQNADNLKMKLEKEVTEPVNVTELKKKNLYIVKIGPIKDYPTTRSLKSKLSQNSDIQVEKTDEVSKSVASNEIKARKKIKNKKKLWNLRNADIKAVIAEVSRVTGKNFIIDPRVQGKITIISSQPLANKELYQVFLSILEVSGYSAIDQKNATKIVPNIDAKTQAPDLLSKLRSPAKGSEMVVEVVPIKYVPSEQLVPVLRPLMPQWSNVSAYAPSNMIILSGRADNIKRLSTIIKQVDSSSANGIDIVRLQHALAMDIVNTLKDIVKTKVGSGLRAKTMLSADDRSNSILISGNKTERIRLRLLISQLDRENKHGNTSNTKVIYLSYLRAEDIVPILAGVAQANFSGTVGTTIGTITKPKLDSTNPASSIAQGSSSSTPFSEPGSGGANEGAGGGINAGSDSKEVSTESEGSSKPKVQIIAEPNTNSVIINAPPTIINILKSVISQLDIRPAQILIEALIAEINQRDIQQLGVEWGSVVQGEDSSAFRPGFAILDSKTSIDDFQAQIYALAEQRKANILSTPSVLVLDNRQAKILVGKQVSVASTSYPNNAGGTTTASPYTTFDRINVALHLYVRPQITRGNGIQMQIDQGNDTIDPSTGTTADNQPVFNISSIVTSVHMDSGDVIILGGLTQDSLADDSNGLPYLENIPGIGSVFQRKRTNREKKVLMVFIKPIILRNHKDELIVTNGKYQHVRNEQLDFIREEEFDPRNKETVYPPINEPKLPKPFMHLKSAKIIIKPIKKLPKTMTK